LNFDFYDLSFGVPVGSFYDGSSVYYGNGLFIGCQESYFPARVTSYGAYTTCGQNAEQFEGTNIDFLYNYPNKTFVNVQIQDLVASLSNSNVYGGDDITAVVVQVTSPTKGNFTTIGRCSRNRGGVIYWNGDEEVLATEGSVGVLEC
jgi:hypothetical protein